MQIPTHAVHIDPARCGGQPTAGPSRIRVCDVLTYLVNDEMKPLDAEEHFGFGTGTGSAAWAAVDFAYALAENPGPCPAPGGYACVVWQEDGPWLVAVPALPDLPWLVGNTPSEALASAADAVASWLDAAREDGRPIPEPS